MSTSPPISSTVDDAMRSQLAAVVPGFPPAQQGTFERIARSQSWYQKYRILLTIADVIVIVIAMAVSYSFRFGDDLRAGGAAESVGVAVLIGAVWLVMLGVVESRSRKTVGAGMDEYRRVMNASVFAFGVVAIVSYLARAEISRFFFAVSLPLGTVLLLQGRWLCRTYLRRLRVSGRAMAKTVVVGRHEQVLAAARGLWRHPEAGFTPAAVCLLDVEPAGTVSPELAGLRRIGLERLDRAASHGAVNAVLVAGGLNPKASRELSWRLERASVELLFVPRLIDVAGPRISVRTIEGLDLMQVDLPRFSGWNYRLKRTFDLLFSAVALLILSPVLIAVAVAIKLDDGGPVLFRQERVGRNGEPFVIHKFRTMCVDAEAKLADLREASIGNGVLFKMDDDPRVTRVGRILRKYSLDELPQFWTALRGDMSVVGPRPHLARELADFPDEGLRRLLIKPGITGLWQVSGRSDLSLEESIRLDLRYVENWSLTGDLVIVIRTVSTMIRPAGAY